MSEQAGMFVMHHPIWTLIIAFVIAGMFAVAMIVGSAVDNPWEDERDQFYH